MTREEFDELVLRLFAEDGQSVAQKLLDEGGKVADFIKRVGAEVSRAKQVEKIFGRGRRCWEIRVDHNTVYFDRLEFHEFPSGTLDRMGESFDVPHPFSKAASGGVSDG